MIHTLLSNPTLLIIVCVIVILAVMLPTMWAVLEVLFGGKRTR